MNAVTASGPAPAAPAAPERRVRPGEIWRIIRLHTVNPGVFFIVPWVIMAGAWAISVVLVLIIGAAGAPVEKVTVGMQYSWAVLSPQWYLVVVGVQAIAFTFQFALGFGATRRDYWLGTWLMFLFVSIVNAIAIATLVMIERATDHWWVGAAMFDALWYVGADWITAAYTTFALQLFVLTVGAAATTVYMRWRMPGMLVLGASAAALVLGAIALLTFTESWGAFAEWFAAVGLNGGFTILVVLALAFGVFGYSVIRRATPR
ncbi:hypothetical protein ACDF64_03145 [Agromyces sp. MMS24-JH15]|uniref:hypothetical protein n=1 Tax=Agromyces sp. MMS24-JH15 TaxID=3243765 RepID=UPI0037481F3F